MRTGSARLALAGFLLLPAALSAQAGSGPPPDTTATACSMCAEWNAPQRPFRIFGNSYYVGPNGLGAVLVTSSEGHVLIDGALPESAPAIIANVEALGFRMEDVKLILNSHSHFDHAGGIAGLQHASGATVAASLASAPVLERGEASRADPQHGALPSFPAARDVRVVADGERLRVGPLVLTAHLTAGHSPGGTSWSWESCEAGRCLDVVYADSQTPVSADGFLFTGSEAYPAALRDFERGHAALEAMPCDVLVTTHPAASRLWERLAAREAGDADALIDPGACRAFAAVARKQLAERIAAEAAVR